MSMLSRWTIGAMASKKARASLPVTPAMASARPGAVSGPVAMIVGPDAGQRVDPLANDLDVGMGGDAGGHLGRKGFAVDRERRAGRNSVLVGSGHDQRAERPHFLVKQADRVVLGIVGAEAVRADHFRQPVGLMRRRPVAAAAHFRQADAQPSFGQLPGGFAPGEPAADDVDVMTHGARLIASPYASP